MPSWKKHQLKRRLNSSVQSRKEKKRRAVRQLLSESLESRMLLATVTAVDPLAGSSDAPTSTNVSATFDEVINAASATTANFVVQSTQGGVLGAADATVSANGMTVTLDPNSNFFAGDLVQVTSTAGIQGTSAGVPRVWQFRTAAAGSNDYEDSSQAFEVGSNIQSFGIEAGDVDGDGDLDLFLANLGPNRVYLNDGSGTFTDSGQSLGDHQSRNVALGDVDGDGDVDAVTANNNGQANRVWTNDGNGVFTESSFGGNNGFDVMLGDLDGDGDLDAFISNNGQANAIYRNDGSGVFSQAGSVGTANPSRGVGLGDLDNDGDLDAIVSNEDAGQRIYLNNGTGTFTDSGQVFMNNRSRGVDIGDFDNDGDLDAFVSSADYTNRILVNATDTGNPGIFTDSGQMLGDQAQGGSGARRTERIKLGDLDGDGDLDAFVINNVGQGNRTWVNDGAGVFTNIDHTDIDTNSNDVALGDFDGDGDLDAAVANDNNFRAGASQTRIWVNKTDSPNVVLAIDNTTIAEDAGIATVTATLSAAFGSDVTVDLGITGTATAGDDYTASGNQIVIPAGSTSGSITVTAVQDTLDEADETVVIDTTNITNGQGGGQVTTTITDDDDAPLVTLAIDNATLAENGGTATVTATLSAASGQDVTVNLGATGTATDGVDYALSAAEIVIAAGATSGSVTVTATDDALDEPDETVILDVTGATGATEDGEQQVTATITDDDEPPTVSLAVDNENIAEDGGVATFTVTLSAASIADNTVNLALSGTATDGTDYNASGTQVVIPAGATSGSITVTSIADLLITEGGETVIVDIDAITGNATEDGVQQATTTIVDDVNGPDVSIAVDNSSIAENGGVATITATLANAFGLDITIDLGLSGTATSGGDYTASGTQIVVPVGQTTGSITVTGVDDAAIEGDETVIVDVAAVVNGNEAGEQQLTITLTDDESPPNVSLSVDNATIAEAGGVAVFTATLSAATERDVTIDLAVSGTATATDDYTLTGTQIVIPAGSTTGSVTATAVDDTADDDAETIVVDIDAVTNANEDGTQQATTTIEDDDEAPPLPPGPTPPNASHDAATNTVVGYTFGAPIPADAATDQTFTVHSFMDGQLLGADTTVSQSGSTAQHTPASSFRPGELVQATVTSALGTPAVWQFRTAVGGGLGTFTNTGQTLGLVNARTYGVSLGDLDGDGDLDAFTSNLTAQGNRVYLNDGTGVFTDSGVDIGSAGGAKIELGDLDGDGDLDAFVSRNGANRTYINDGNAVFVDSGQGIGNGNTRETQLADLDADGDLDAVSANNGANIVWVNDGSGIFAQGGSMGDHNSFSIALSDVDNDGDIDAFSGNAIGQFDRVWLNNGSGSFTDSGQQLGDVANFNHWSEKVIFGDVDNDGDQDVWAGQRNYENKLLLNDGTGVFSDSGQVLDVSRLTGQPRRTTGGAFGDFDADGDLDILEMTRNRQLKRIWSNDGTGIFTVADITGSGRYTPDVAVGDVDGDGDLDFFFIGESDLTPEATQASVWTNANPVITVTLAVDNANIPEEAGVATVTATISGVSGSPVTIDLNVGGSATDGVDYTISGTQIVIPGGSTSGSVTVTAIQDALDEADETVVVDIASVTGATGTGQATVTITDDDEAPLVGLAVDTATIGEDGGVATATATLSAASGQDVTVTLGATGTATDGDDYALSATEIVIAAGSTSGSVTITANDDAVDEPDETVILDVTGITGATEDGEQQVTVTITDDDEPPTVSLAIDNENVDEDGGVATVSAVMSAQSLQDVTVDLAVSGTATGGGTDYNISGTQVVIPAGSTSGSVTITSVADLLITEGSETVVVDIDAVTNATEDGTQQVTATIIDDVGGPDVTIAIDNTDIAENGGTATVTATLASAFALDVTLDLALTGTASATDYNASSTQIVVPAGSTTGSMTITAVEDTLIEDNETIIVDVAAVINGNEATEQQVTTTITDDEAKPTVALSIDVATIAEGAVATVTATSSAVSEQDVTVALAFGGTATQPDGYTVSAAEIVIAAGSTSGTATITATDEGLDDGDQTVVVDIDTVTNGTEDGTQQVTTTILDDDEAPPIPPGPEPARNSHDIPRNNQVAFNFGDNVTAATEQTFVVHGTHSVGQLVGNLTTFSVDGPIASHVPTNEFAPGEIVNVTATGGITTSTGAIEPTVWQFRTAATAGSGQFEDTGQVIPGGPGFVVFGDADGDGDLDALQGVNLWLNDGNAVFTDSGQNVGSGQERDFADVDGDGDLDVVSNSIWFNDGAGVFTQGGNAGGGLAIDVGDLDGDGDLDIFRGTGGYNGAQAWMNDGNGNFTDSGQVLNGSFDQPRGVQLGDLDNDGDLDAFVGSWQTDDRVWLNDGSGIFTLAFSTQSPISSTADVDLGDFDNDGDLDVLLGHAGGTGQGDMTSRILFNDGTGANFTQAGAIDPGRTTWATEVGDMDADGDLDLVIVNRTGGAGSTIWLNDGTGNFGAGSTFTFAGDRRIYGGDIGDLNGDGALDIWEANVHPPTGDRIWLNQLTEPQASLSIDADTIPETGGVATVTATLSAAHTAEVTIDLALSGSATDVDDYIASGTQIIIPVGATSGSITLTTVEDTADEPDETIVVSVTAVTNAQGGGSVMTTILDDDEAVPPDVSIAVDNADIPEEAGVATFTVTLSAATSVDVTVDLALSGTASASDYTASGTQVVIPVGSTSGSITVTAVQDTEDEQNETVIVDIDTVTGGNEAGTQQATTTITDDDGPASFAVSTFEATSTGFNAVLNAAIDVDDLNLYDTSAGLGAADVVLTGATTGPVAGTLVIAADNQTISFIATGGVLAADTYTATLRSAADGFEDTTARLLDGNGDGTAGDDYTSEFTVATPVPNAVTLSLPDIVRGPGQPVNVPADATTGLPLSISEGAGVRNVTVSLDYDPAFLEITAAAVGANMPAGSAVTLDTSTAGAALLTFTSPVDLPAGANTLVDLTAAVPTADANAIYRSKQVLNLHSASVTDGSAANIPVIDDDSLHAIEYFADVSGNGRVNAADASQVAQFAALLVDGFAASQNADPIVVGDVSGNGRVNAADASQVAQVAALLPVANIPLVPAGVVSTPITGGPDPKLSLPKDVTAAAGETFTVALELDSIENLQAPNRIGSGTVIVEYDANVLSATNVTAGSFITSNSWSIVPNIATPGRVIVVAFGTNPVGGQFVDTFVNLEFAVNAAAPAGPTALNIVDRFGAAQTELLSESDQPLTLIPPPTPADSDEIDGLVTIAGGGPTVSLAVDNASIAEAGGVATFTATLSETVTADVTVDLGLTGTATNPDDYTASGNQIVIAAGATSGSVTVTAVDDTVDDDDETVIVDITNVTGAAENGEQQATTTITDDDEPVVEPGNRLTISKELQGAPGAEVAVPVNIELVNLPVGQRLLGIGAVVSYDAAILELTSVDNGDFVTSNTGWTLVPNTGTPGQAVLVGFTTTPTTGPLSQVLATLNFTVLAGAPAGPTSLNLVDGFGPARTELLDEADDLIPLADAVTADPGDRADGVLTVGAAGPTVSLAVDNASIAEAGGVATFTATLSETVTSDVTVDLGLTGTATNPDDYTASGNQIVIAAGATSGSITVTAVDDTVDDDDETVIVDITNVTGAAENGEQQATTTITDDDEPVELPTVSLAVDNADIAEAGGVATVTATLSAAATADVTVELGLSGTATNPDDYTASGTQIVIAAGATSGSVTVTAVDDAIDDDAETVIVDITSVVGANEAGEQQVTTTITDDDEPAVEPGNRLTISKELQAAPGAEVAVPVNIELVNLPVGQRLLGIGAVVSYDAAILELTSVDNGDFVTSNTGWTLVPNTGTPGQAVLVGFTTTPTTGPLSQVLATLNFTVLAGAPAGPTSLNLVDGFGPARTELLDEGDNLIPLADAVTADPGDRADGVLTVVGTAGPTVSLAVDNASIAEAGGVATFTATLSETVTSDVTVDLGLTGTATDPDDYTASGNQIVIAAGATSGSITVTAVDDTVDDDDETVIVDITNVTGAAENGEQQATTTITDDDEPALPTVSLAVDNADIAEAGGVATFTATLSAAATADVTVDLGLSGTATNPDDYTASGTQIVIATGATSGSVTVTAVDDTLDEENETVVADITNVVGATEDGEQQATTTITDDDEPVLPTVSLAVDNETIAEAGGVATFTATLSATSTSDVTIDLGITGTAANAADYTASGNQIVIAAGSTSGSITVTAIDDTLDEEDETVVVDITNVTGATGSGVAITTITDDDELGPNVTLAVDPAAIPEAGGVATLTATLSEVLTSDVVVDLAYSGTATGGTDYTASATQLTIAAGATTASATISALQDTEVEVDETVIVDITVTGAAENGEQQVTVTIGDDDGVNDPPDLENPGDQSFAETQDTFDVTLVATDPNPGDTLTYSATVEGGELYLDQTLDLNFTGDFFTNFSGLTTAGRFELNEKWLLGGDGRTWYYIEPSGDFYRWLGSGVLNREFVAQVSTAAYDDPALLYDAQPGGVTSPVTASVVNNVVTLDPPAGFTGSFTVVATVSDGERTDIEMFLVQVEPNQAPELENPGDQTLPTTQDTLDVPLVATDPMDDAITLTAEVQSGEYYLDQTIGFQVGPDGLVPNWSGTEDERWLLADDGETWYFITPDGSFYRWLAQGDRNIMANSELVAQLSPATHADPALLHDAQPGAAVPAVVSVNGTTLTIDPNAGFVGTFGVLLTATDVGGLTDSEWIRVDVTASPAKGIQIPLSLGRPSAAPSDASVDRALQDGELGFNDSLLGTVPSGHEDAPRSNDSDTAFEQLLDEDLIDDELLEDLVSDL